MSGFALPRVVACARKGKAEELERLARSRFGGQDKSGSLFRRKPLLAHGFWRAVRSVRVPRPRDFAVFSTPCPAPRPFPALLGEAR